MKEGGFLKRIHLDLKGFDKLFKVTGLDKGSSKGKRISFKATIVQTRGFKFDREKANTR
jgi:hypothetical protein